MKIKVQDKVLVIAGKYKGKTGSVMRVYKKTNHITVEKVNVRTRHIKKTPTHAGQKIKYEAPFDVSKAQLICPNCNKATRVAYSIPKQGKKFRICLKCNESVEQAVAKTEKKKK
ncbi:50S ribosomal protein L24 [Candidatus Peregrinibacteria bacterium]|nr:50S ribosomal protein L24 [Candidatus Peregrinibacteria bacterium]